MKKETQKKKWTKKTKERGERLKNNSYGITLIALVITVIVLLILAAISISMLNGDNSILSRATQAKNETGTKQIQEKIRLAVAGAIVNGNGSITEDLLKAELNKQFGENGYELIDKEDDSWDVKVGEVIENVKKSGAITGGGAGENNKLTLTANVRETESRAAVIEVSVAAGTPPTEEELQAKSQDELKPMFLAAIQKEGAPYKSWDEISQGDNTMTIEGGYNKFASFLSSKGYSNAYDLIIKTGAYAEPVTFTLNGETITGTSAEFVVTKKDEYTISALQGGNSGTIKVDPDNKCKIEEYSTICENNTNLKVGTNGLEPALEGDTIVAVCPAGFAYGTSTNVGTVATGLVITDHVEEVTVDRKTKRYSDGNEFVWIPIDKNTLSPIGTTNKAMANSAGTQGNLYKIASTSNDVGTEPTLLSSYDTDEQYYKTILGYNSSTNFGNAITNSYTSMITSVKQYGGFYVGRYEMGQGSGNYSKIGITPTSSNEDETKTWYGLYKKAKEYNKSSVEAGMIWGSQYDAMLNYALSNENDSGKVNANSNGNHSGKLLKTGTWLGTSSQKDSINNIFDLEGNLFEWTQEAYGAYGRVRRGGYFSASSTGSPSGRGNGDPDDTSYNGGSRLGLYIR